jgi:hypothetical protein
MGLFEKYKFTNKRHSLRSIMAVNIALIGIVAIVASVWLGYKNNGVVEPQHAVAVLLAVLLSVVGLCMAIAGRLDPERYRIFPNLGIVLNLLVLVCGAVFLILGSG